MPSFGYDVPAEVACGQQNITLCQIEAHQPCATICPTESHKQDSQRTFAASASLRMVSQ